MLSKKTKYGLKALTYLARIEGREPVQIAEIAKHENISQKFLESILLTLRRNGFLGSKKGKGGGYYLIKEPKDISMTTVMRVLEISLGSLMRYYPPPLPFWNPKSPSSSG